eukprot:270269_1
MHSWSRGRRRTRPRKLVRPTAVWISAAWYGRFAEYCSKHHRQQVEDEMKNPSAEMWLKQPEKVRIFTPFLLSDRSVSTNDLAFVRAVDDFRQLDGAAAIQNRAQIIRRAYLRENAAKRVEVDGETEREIVSALYDHPTNHLFDEAVAQVMNKIRKVFTDHFLVSDEYREYCELTSETKEVARASNSECHTYSVTAHV